MDINKYNLMIPPFEFVPFEKMNIKQAIEVLSRVMRKIGLQTPAE